MRSPSSALTHSPLLPAGGGASASLQLGVLTSTASAFSAIGVGVPASVAPIARAAVSSGAMYGSTAPPAAVLYSAQSPSA